MTKPIVTISCHGITDVFPSFSLKISLAEEAKRWIRFGWEKRHVGFREEVGYSPK